MSRYFDLTVGTR